MLETVHGTFILTNEMSNEREFSREFETSSPYVENLTLFNKCI